LVSDETNHPTGSTVPEKKEQEDTRQKSRRKQEETQTTPLA